MSQMERVSLTLEQVVAIKRYATRGAPYADRVSLGFAVALDRLGKQFGEDYDVSREIDALEGLSPHSSTKRPTQFKRPPLRPFWHKHFSTSRHLMRNVGLRWGLEKSGNCDFSAAIERVTREYGDQPDLWQKRLPYQIVLGGLHDRTTARRMTGDWIIFARHEGRNFYLGLGTHEESRDAIYQRLRDESECEFPFLFPSRTANDR
jgi:hypothetical protein